MCKELPAFKVAMPERGKMNGILYPYDEYITNEEHCIQSEIIESRGGLPREQNVSADWDIDMLLSDDRKP
jgi:hypothetical protein